MIKSGDYQYILLTDGTAELTNYTAYAEFLTVPAQIDGHAVTSIGSEAFINSEFLSSIILPDCLTTIGIDAFCGCSFHTSITLPNSLTTIGNWAFKSFSRFSACAYLSKKGSNSFILVTILCCSDSGGSGNSKECKAFAESP